MITKARVSLAGVTAFKNSVTDLETVSAKFDSGICCLRDIQYGIDNQIIVLKESNGALEKGKDIADKKIREIEEDLARLIAQRESIQSDLDAVENEMASTPSSYTYTDDEGNSHEVPNPADSALCVRASALESELTIVDGQIAEKQIHLDRAQSVTGRIAAQIDANNAVIYSLEEKKSDCAKMIADVEEVKFGNTARCAKVHELLTKIEQIIQTYLSTVIKFDNSVAYNGAKDITAEQLVGINISISVRQVIVNEPAGKDWIDDNGKAYRIGDDLIKDNTFQVNGYEYKTDHHGRPISASGKLSINELGQSNRQMDDAMSVIGKGDERPAAIVDGVREGDDRGHLIGHQFNGSDRMENMVPQDWRINQKSFRKLEDSLATQVKTGHDVSVSVIPFYGGDSRRPDGIFYFYNIDGVSNVVLFPNDVSEEET